LAKVKEVWAHIAAGKRNKFQQVNRTFHREARLGKCLDVLKNRRDTRKKREWGRGLWRKAYPIDGGLVGGKNLSERGY